MRVLGITGWSGSGKTTLITSLLTDLVARGLSVSTIKHAHHQFQIDHPGKDSFVHRDAGACEVMVGSGDRWALIHELRGAPEPSLEDLLGRMSPVDLVLVEGFKSSDHEKIEVFRAGNDKPPLYPNDRKIIAIASDTALPDAGRPVLALDDTARIAEFIVNHCRLQSQVA